MARYLITNIISGLLAGFFVFEPIIAFAQSCEAQFARVDANLECDPGRSNSKQCDKLLNVPGTKYKAPTNEWQACYREIAECRVKIGEENKDRSAKLYRCQQEAKQKEIDRKNWERDKARADAFVKKCRENPNEEGCRPFEFK